MSNPLGLLPIAIAAGGGTVDSYEAQQLVAAGLTLLQRSAPLVRAMHRRRAAILLPTSPAYLTALAASEGRAAVLINPLASSAEIAFQLRDADVGAVFTIAPLAALLPDWVPRVLLDDAPRHARVVVDGAARDVDLGSHHGLSIEAELDVPGSDEAAAIVYTSAMAGIPLGAVLTHANLLSNARATIDAGALDADDHSLALLPFAHLFGLVVSGAAPLLARGRIATMARFNPARAIELIETEGITMVVAVPAVFAAMAALLERRGAGLRTDRLRLCICGGAPLAAELQDRWDDLTGLELRQGYGLTEAGPVCLFNRTDRPNRRGTLGVPFPGVRVTVLDESDDRELSEESAGEIAVAGPNVFAGYVRVPALGVAPTDPYAQGLRRAGEWLRTGDRGIRHADGTISFVDCIKPMFTRNGFNIYPREIERVVGELPGVVSARVTPVPDAAHENEIAVDVTGTASAEDVRAWCEQQLGAYKRPSVIRTDAA